MHSQSGSVLRRLYLRPQPQTTTISPGTKDSYTHPTTPSAGRTGGVLTCWGGGGVGRPDNPLIAHVADFEVARPLVGPDTGENGIKAGKKRFGRDR